MLFPVSQPSKNPLSQIYHATKQYLFIVSPTIPMLYRIILLSLLSKKKPETVNTASGP
jgi:hypothetical protein